MTVNHPQPHNLTKKPHNCRKRTSCIYSWQQ